MAENYLDRLPASLKKSGDHVCGEIELLPPQGEKGFGVLYEDPYLLLVRDRVLFPGGKEGSYVRIINVSELTGGAGTVMVPVWSGEITFIRIFRHATRSWEWELPRGYLEPALTEAANAEKEILEELGVASKSFRRIGEVNPNTGLLSSLIGVYAVDLVANPAAHGRPQKAEGIERFQSVPISQITEFVANENVHCGISLAALFLYLNQRQQE